jgi:hypothetical protein
MTESRPVRADLIAVIQQKLLCFLRTQSPWDLAKTDQYESGSAKKAGFIENPNAFVVAQRPYASGTVHDHDDPRLVFRNSKPMLQFAEPPINTPHRLGVPLGAACSSAAKRASMSSSSMPWIA